MRRNDPHEKNFTGSLPTLVLKGSTINWVPHSRLLGISLDDKLTWTKHLSDLKRVFVNKLSLLKRSRFLPRCMVWDLYNKVILPSITYALLIWGGGGGGGGRGVQTSTALQPWRHYTVAPRDSYITYIS